MAFIKSAVKLIIREINEYHYDNPVLALGVPEIYATYNELKEWFPALAGRDFPLEPSQVSITINEIGKKLGWITAGTFFKALGLNDVTSIDIPGCEHEPDIVHNLNDPIPTDLHNCFNLILDPGTIEHVFDIKTSLSNIVRALVVGGVVIHQVPIYSYNGGYYSINPNVMRDFYARNGFRNIKAYIIMWDRFRAYQGKSRVYPYIEEHFGARYALADHDQSRFCPLLLFFAKKEVETQNIVSPNQFGGEYYPQPGFGQEKRQRQGYTQIIKWVLKFLPFPVAFYLRSSLAREYQLYKTHKLSFWI